MKNKTKRIIFLGCLITLIAAISNYLIRNTTIASISILKTENLFTYFGVLIGFAITIYTFGLSMVSDIKDKINKHKKLSEDKKKSMYHLLVSGFEEIKGDIWLIFYSIIIVIIFSIAKEITNPFGWNVEIFKLPETANCTLFVTTTIAMWDIMRTLFNLSEINLELNKNEHSGNNQ